ncbi:MAG: hypothetical protein SOR89_04970 [Ndongobacter sp.]|nr:hypothetical protein [Ndongobacter sp.]
MVRRAKIKEPVLKIPNTVWDRIVLGGCILGLAGSALYVGVRWSALPEQLTGLSGNGAVGKGVLWLFVGISLSLFIILSVVERMPGFWNLGVPLNDANRAQVYRMMRNMIGFVKLLAVFLMSYLTVILASGRAVSGAFLIGVAAVSILTLIGYRLVLRCVKLH